MKKTLIAAALTAGIATAALAAPASAATVTTVCAAGCDYSTIQSAVDAAAAGDTVQLTGGLTVAGTTTVNKDVTVTGTPGATVTQTANAITFLMSGAGSSLSDLTITSDAAYAKEFVQVGAKDVTISGTTIYGPAQALPMSGWVGNRALVTQHAVSGLTVTDNTFHSLRSGAYLNPNGTGVIEGNTVYNTKGDFLIDNADFTFTDNQAGRADQPSEWGFVIFPSTATDRYTSLEALSSANNYMTAIDQRTGKTFVAPRSAADCRNGGWATSAVTFSNQGQCIKFVTVPSAR